MQGDSTLIVCGSCSREIADRSSKEVFYQVGKQRFRFEFCPNCLDDELARRDGHRGIPGFHKRAAILIAVDSVDELPHRRSR